VKFKVGDIIRFPHLEYYLYREVVGILSGKYEVTWFASTPSEAANFKNDRLHKSDSKGGIAMGMQYIDDNYVLDTEYKRITAFNVDLQDILSEV